MAISRKKIIARFFTSEWLAGYLPVDGFADAQQIELLSLEGKKVQVKHEHLKWVCFVKEFNSGVLENPEHLLKKTFVGRPRGFGLWLRVRLKDNDALEGLAENDMRLVAEPGIFITPPDMRSNTQRIWLPRTSLAELEVVAVLHGNQRKAPMPASAASLQESLFSEEPRLPGKLQSTL